MYLLWHSSRGYRFFTGEVVYPFGYGLRFNASSCSCCWYSMAVSSYIQLLDMHVHCMQYIDSRVNLSYTHWMNARIAKASTSVNYLHTDCMHVATRRSRMCGATAPSLLTVPPCFAVLRTLHTSPQRLRPSAPYRLSLKLPPLLIMRQLPFYHY